MNKFDKVINWTLDKLSAVEIFIKVVWQTLKQKIAVARSWFRKKTTPTPTVAPVSGKSANALKVEQGQFVGLRFSAFQWNVLVRPVLSLAISAVVVLLLCILDRALGTNLIDFMIAGLLVLFFAFVVGTSEGETPEVVPAAHAAMVTWFGMRLHIYRTEGNYYWTGKKLLLGRYTLEPNATAEIPVGVDKAGFINLGEIQISIWNQSDTKDKILMELVASDSTTIQATLVIVIRLLDPMAWTTSENPLLDIAERARSTFRTAASFFTGVDNAAIKSVLGTLMSGKTIIASFIPKVVGSDAPGSIVKDKSGTHMYEVLKHSSQHELDDAVAAFKVRLGKESNEVMLKAITNADGSYAVKVRTIEEAIEEVVETVGASLIRASVGTVILPEKVRASAEQAASEAKQREGQVASARAFAEAKNIMDEAKKPGDEVAAAIAAAQDNPNIKVVFVPGADPLTRAAVAAATQINP